MCGHDQLLTLEEGIEIGGNTDLERPVREWASNVHIDAEMRMLQAHAEPAPGALVAVRLEQQAEERDAPSHKVTPQVKAWNLRNSLSWNLQR